MPNKFQMFNNDLIEKISGYFVYFNKNMESLFFPLAKGIMLFISVILMLGGSALVLYTLGCFVGMIEFDTVTLLKILGFSIVSWYLGLGMNKVIESE